MFDIPDPRLPFSTPTRGFTRTWTNDHEIIRSLAETYPDLCPKVMEIRYCANSEALGDWKYLSFDTSRYISDVSEVGSSKYLFFTWSEYPTMKDGGHMVLLHIEKNLITIYDSSRFDEYAREYIFVNFWPTKVPVASDIIEKIWDRKVIYADIPQTNFVEKDIPLLKKVSLREEGYCVIWSIIYFLLIKKNIDLHVFKGWTENKLLFYALSCFHALTRKNRFTRGLVVIDYTHSTPTPK